MPLSSVKSELYADLLEKKVAAKHALFSDLELPDIKVFSSTPLAYRMRAEFRLWHQDDDLYYAMFKPEQPKIPCRIDSFPIGSVSIQKLMPTLLKLLKANTILRDRLFQAEFLTSQTGQAMITLIYHRQLDDNWLSEAKILAKDLGVHLIGRSKKQKLVLDIDYIEETLTIDDRHYHYRQYEQAFTQPNAGVNEKMITWAKALNKNPDADLIELYCGNGNFTLPLADNFRKVLATEISKTSVKAAEFNLQRNNIDNIDMVRMSAEDICKALQGEREFRRLQNIALDEFNFSTIFVDPPRAGLDKFSEKLVNQFDHIIYISCNPHTLSKNLEKICKTHSIEKFAFFDQFPYTDHMESGVYLKKR